MNIRKNVFITGLMMLLFISNVFSQTVVRSPKWGQTVENKCLRNLYRVNDLVYRSEQPDSLGFKALAEMGLKSVLNLRDKHSDIKFANGLVLKLYDVNMKASDFTDKEIVQALQILYKSPKPVLVHCKHGSDRTGVVIAMYRIVFENWTKQEAIDEMINGSYGFHEKYTNIPAYIEQVNIKQIKQLVFSEN